MAKIHLTQIPCVVAYIPHTRITCLSRIHDFLSCQLKFTRTYTANKFCKESK
ncbi:hypothetical protein MtrunA17_Chr1g0155041 [Medicago truncatula]|uniref:Uncharacterized protein n=1 Tax=Medicago truncatula TaxID=3880 RepID=A0A396JMB4_MEDTR|nr:hypothetical protein MtrunA17_Chr1g0155041 [Medicago truncatula]